MPIVQDAFYIPDDIATGLATGLYRRIGSVVRYATEPNNGQIVKHLDPINTNVVEKAQGVGVKALRFVQQHKKVPPLLLSEQQSLALAYGDFTSGKTMSQKHS